MIQKIIYFINNNPGLLIASLALAVSIYESYRRRKHDRLSVQPLIDTYCRLYPEKANAYLRNIGYGPARITNFKIIIKGKEIESIEAVLNSLKDEIKLPESNIKLERFSFPHTLEANGEIIILGATPPKGTEFDSSELAIFKNFIGNISIQIEYQSIYKKKVKATLSFVT